MAKAKAKDQSNKPEKPAKQYRPPDPGALLLNRQQAARLLGCSVPTLVRLESQGRLRALKLNPTQNGMAYYKASQVRRLAGGDA